MRDTLSLLDQHIPPLHRPLFRILLGIAVVISLVAAVLNVLNAQDRAVVEHARRWTSNYPPIPPAPTPEERIAFDEAIARGKWIYPVQGAGMMGLMALMFISFGRMATFKTRINRDQAFCCRCAYDLHNARHAGACPECGTAYDLERLRASYLGYKNGPLRRFRHKRLFQIAMLTAGFAPGLLFIVYMLVTKRSPNIPRVLLSPLLILSVWAVVRSVYNYAVRRSRRQFDPISSEEPFRSIFDGSIWWEHDTAPIGTYSLKSGSSEIASDS